MKTPLLRAAFLFLFLWGCGGSQQSTPQEAIDPDSPDVLVAEEILDAVAHSARSENDRARDVYRHPAATLAFFDIKPNMHVIELWPGGGPLVHRDTRPTPA